MALTADDYRGLLQNLLPSGPAWPREPSAFVTRMLDAWAQEFARIDARVDALIEEADPRSTLELLPDWESMLGLPDPCAGESPTLQQRHAAVVAKLVNGGGQSEAFFVEFAQSLGYEISISTFRPARINEARCGDRCYGQDWIFAWSVDLPLTSVVFARINQSTIGEPLANWGNDVIQCQLQDLKPAHTVLLFRYLTEIFDNTVVDDFGHPVLTSDGYPIVI
ncbi:YmfQ family protein [Caballeronia cordobensis]|uniref:YmfQ family protein n=1 Tax=Caballeronia cordobensis TaxID=1353886 RepID=UPI00045EF649|nr:putative membrane protein [Burkholderia sp. RPE67]